MFATNAKRLYFFLLKYNKRAGRGNTCLFFLDDRFPVIPLGDLLETVGDHKYRALQTFTLFTKRFTVKVRSAAREKKLLTIQLNP